MSTRQTAMVLDVLAYGLDGQIQRAIEREELASYAYGARLLRANAKLLEHRDIEAAIQLVELMAANPKIRLTLRDNGEHDTKDRTEDEGGDR